MDDDFELDQDTGIWRPRRRTFIFLLGAAAVGSVLGGPVAETHSGIAYLAEIGEWPGVGLGMLSLGKQPGRGVPGPREYIVVNGHPRRNPEYRP